MLSPFIHDVIRDTIKKQDCEPCDSTDRACPSVATGATSRCNFSKNVCIDDETGACVPRLLGVEGRVSLGTLLAKYGAPPSAALDLSVGAGGTAKVGTGIDLGTRAGIYAVQVDTCVAPVPPPALPDVPAPDFDAIAGGTGYHAAVSLSQPFLALAFHHVQQAGGLCVTIDSTQVPTLNSGLLKTFLPSLGPLVERDGKAAPMKLVLRPGAPPEVAIGEGTYDPVTKKAIKPLLTLTLRDLALDFYAQLDDRDVRLFSITADVAIPLSLIVEDCSSVRPALGDLSGLVTRVKSTESALLAEDPKVLADLVPIGVGMAEPMLATALTAFSLPTAGNFKLQVNAIHGVSPIPGTDQYFHVGFFGTLVDAGATCTAPVAGFSAGLAGTSTTLSKMGWPTVKLTVGGEATAPVSYSVRVDDGFWSDFLPADADRSLSVSHPALLAEGPHRISVRARAGDASSDGTRPHRAGEDRPRRARALPRVRRRRPPDRPRHRFGLARGRAAPRGELRRRRPGPALERSRDQSRRARRPRAHRSGHRPFRQRRRAPPSCGGDLVSARHRRGRRLQRRRGRGVAPRARRCSRRCAGDARDERVRRAPHSRHPDHCSGRGRRSLGARPSRPTRTRRESFRPP